APDGVGVKLRQRGSPGIVTLEKAADVVAPLPELVPGTGLEHDHPDAAPGELEGHDAAGRPGADDTDLGLHRGRLARRSGLALRAGVARELPAAAGEGLVAHGRPTRGGGVVASDQIGDGPRAEAPHLVRKRA